MEKNIIKVTENFGYDKATNKIVLIEKERKKKIR